MICEDYSGKTIRSYLKDLSFSKRCLSFLSNHSGTVFLNDIEVPLLTALAAGDHLRIVFFDDMSDEIIKTEIPLDIVYEDEDIIVIKKQSGLGDTLYPFVSREEDRVVVKLCGDDGQRRIVCEFIK